MTKTVWVTARVHRDVPACCRSSIIKFGAVDVYRGAGEPGDLIHCGCGNWLGYGWMGWRVVTPDTQETP